MSKYEEFVNWLDSYRDVAFDLLRMYLGVGLFVRGILFLYDPAAVTDLVEPASRSWLTSPGLLYVVALLHVVGGAMMAVGFLTRVATLVQIPILAGAVFLVHLRGGLLDPNQSFEFSALVLFLLLLIFLYDSGRWSVDHYLESRFHFRVFPKLDSWVAPYRAGAFDLLRMYLGVGLFVRGILFISDSSNFMELLGPSSGAMLTSIALVHYITLAHLVGGAMMAIGFLTRVAALLQIPILAGAVFLIHFQGGLLAPSQSFEFSVLVLFLLILIFLYGSGPWSADYYLFVRKAEEADLTELSPRARMFLHRDETMPAGQETPAAALTATEPHVATETEALTCPLLGAACPVISSEDPRHHPQVEPTRHYSVLAGFYFLTGITGPPKEIVFQCRRCGQVIDRSRDPEDLAYYKYR